MLLIRLSGKNGSCILDYCHVKLFFSRYPITKCHVSVKSIIWDPRMHLGRFISHLIPTAQSATDLTLHWSTLNIAWNMCVVQCAFITQAWTPNVLLLFQTVQHKIFKGNDRITKSPSQNFRHLFRNYSKTVILLNQAHQSCIDINKNQDIHVAPLTLLDAFRDWIGWNFCSVSIKWWAWWGVDIVEINTQTVKLFFYFLQKSFTRYTLLFRKYEFSISSWGYWKILSTSSKVLDEYLRLWSPCFLLARNMSNFHCICWQATSNLLFSASCPNSGTYAYLTHKKALLFFVNESS